MNIWTLRFLGLVFCLFLFGVLFRSWLNPPTPNFLNQNKKTIHIPKEPELTLQSTNINISELRKDSSTASKTIQKTISNQSEIVGENNQSINSVAFSTTDKKSFIQVGAFGEKINAQNILDTLKDNKFKPFIETVEVNKKTLYRVLIGPIKESQVNQITENLKLIGIEEAKHIHR